MPQNHGELDKITKHGRVSRVVDISCFSGAHCPHSNHPVQPPKRFRPGWQYYSGREIQSAHHSFAMPRKVDAYGARLVLSGVRV